MSIQIGDRIPAAQIRIMGNDGVETLDTQAYFANRKVVMFAVPGAFTPTCSISHLPGFVDNAELLFDKGIDVIACLSVNDAFVMDAWARSANADQLEMLADGNGDFTTALGLELDATAFGMGKRSMRFALVADNGIITGLFIEAPGEFLVSSAEHILANL